VKSLYLFIFLLCCNTQLFADHQADRSRFLSAYQQIKKGNVTDYQALTKNLQHYILYPYLEHAYLNRHIEQVKASELVIFLKRFSNSVLANDIRDKWIAYLAKQQEWNKILNYYIADNASLKSRCFYNEALIKTGQTTRGFKDGKALWMSKRKLPQACNNLSLALQQAKQLSAADYWQRISLLMNNNQLNVVNNLIQYLPLADQKRVKNWQIIHKETDKYLANYLRTNFVENDDSPHSRQIILYGLKRLMKKDTVYTEIFWQQFKTKYQFTAAEQGEIESALYYRAARKHQMSALPKLLQIPAQYRSKNASLWMARLAVRVGHWDTVLNAINGMDKETQVDGAWIYWKARALQQLGDNASAQTLLQKNAQNITFYGLLSADRLQQPYTVLQKAPPDRSAKMTEIKKLIAIQRALELFAIGKNTLASREWFKVISTLDKEGKLAAAELALQHKQAFTAILTVSKTKDWNIADLRFPLLYKQLILDSAKQQQIDPAWVYGVIRRESAFKADALSRVKAFGLMQLMPNTAKEVAKKLNLKNLTLADFAEPITNIKLGSGYLAQMYKRFNNYPKATAAYNAGPGRIARWTPDAPLAADQWIESIPFNETRKYVSSVMAYSTIYDYKLNNHKAKRLSQRLQPILPVIKKTKIDKEKKATTEK
jgi:soluble lytic murein transglycosylase